MKRILRILLPALCGAAYAALAVLLSRLLITHLSGLFSLIAGPAGLSADAAAYVSQILGQFRSAALVSPWLPALLIGAVIGMAAAWLIRLRHAKHITIDITLWILLLIPLSLVALYFTQVNGIMTGNLLKTFLPMLPELL
ncbi:MAG: hypothetical protein IJE08_13430 [Clostridia bacterium]|nr:hypothetical protein [Clostridia bacterium]